MFVTRKETHLSGWQLMVVTMMWFSCLCKQEQMWMLQIIGKLHLSCQHFARQETNLILCFSAKCFQNSFLLGFKSERLGLEESNITQQNYYFDKMPALK